MKPIIFPFNILANPWNAEQELLLTFAFGFIRKTLRKVFGIKKPPSPYEQALQALKAKRTANQWAYDDWMSRNPWFADWQAYAGDAQRQIGSFGDNYAQAKSINDMYQRDVDNMYGDIVGKVMGSGIGSYESDQQGLFNRRADAAISNARLANESNQQNFSNSLAQMAQNFGTSQGGFGSGFASALGGAFQQGAQQGAEKMGAAQQGIEQDRTGVYDKVFGAKMNAPQQIDMFRKTALDSMLAPAETALAGWDSITSRQRQNAPRIA